MESGRARMSAFDGSGGREGEDKEKISLISCAIHVASSTSLLSSSPSFLAVRLDLREDVVDDGYRTDARCDLIDGVVQNTKDVN